MRLEFLDLLDGALDAPRRRQHLVDLVGGHTVGHQRRLQHAFPALAVGAFAREFLDIPEVGPALGPFVAIGLGVPGQHGGEHVATDVKRLCRAGNEAGDIDDLVVERLQHPFSARARSAARSAGHHVPGDCAGLDLQRHCGDAGVGFFLDGDAQGLGRRNKQGLALRLLVGTTEGHHGQLGCRLACKTHRQCRSSQGHEAVLESLDHHCITPVKNTTTVTVRLGPVVSCRLTVKTRWCSH